jgi:AcrR family transcriptional regulator
MAPDDRRRAIIEAVIPLLVEHGAAVTTRQMADAAGIAEGTIFGVFPGKRELIEEAIKHSMDPEPVQRELSQLHPEAPIEIQIAEATRILIERFSEVIALMGVLRTMPSSGVSRPPFVAEANNAINASLTELFERHRSRLRIEPSRAATALRGLVFAASHPMIEKLTVNEIVGVLLSGILDQKSASEPESIVRPAPELVG